MRSASSQLKAFLASATAYVRANLYTFTLTNGSVYWFTDADVPVTISGTTFQPTGCIVDRGYSTGVGISVDTLQLKVSDDGRTLIAGVPFLTYLRSGGFDNAVVTAQRAYWANWGEPLQGVITRFAGRLSEIKDSGRLNATLMVTSWAELLNVYMPTDVFQSSCRNMLFDANCTLDPNNFKATAAINGASDQRNLATNLVASAGVYALGTILFTSGNNSGVRRSITAQDASGNLTLVAPLPVAPQVGDAFSVFLGCDRSQGVCQTKFNNLIHFRGEPYIPSPEVAV